MYIHMHCFIHTQAINALALMHSQTTHVHTLSISSVSHNTGDRLSKLPPALKFSQAVSVCIDKVISLPDTHTQGSGISENPSGHPEPSKEAGLGKILAHEGQAQGKGDRMDSVSSSPAAVTRVPREARGVGRESLGGGRRWWLRRQRGVWGEEREADGTRYNSGFVLRFPAPWERQEDYETRCLWECQDISWKKNNTKIK